MTTNYDFVDYIESLYREGRRAFSRHYSYKRTLTVEEKIIAAGYFFAQPKHLESIHDYMYIDARNPVENHFSRAIKALLKYMQNGKYINKDEENKKLIATITQELACTLIESGELEEAVDEILDQRWAEETSHICKQEAALNDASYFKDVLPTGSDSRGY